jgi:hypothetical protein
MISKQFYAVRSVFLRHSKRNGRYHGTNIAEQPVYAFMITGWEEVAGEEYVGDWEYKTKAV